MRIQHSPKVTRSSRFVNTALTLAAFTGLAALTPVSAHAFSNNIMKTEYSVKFKISEVKSPTGLKTVYEKLSKKAAKACSFGKNVDDNGEIISESACAQNLLTQFVEDASVEELSLYHETQTMTKKSAALK